MKFSATSLKNEKIVLERKYKSILPILLMIPGVALTIIGLILMIEVEIPVFFLGGIVLLVIGAILNAYADIFLVVTDKRVYCDGPFRNYISLPLEHISSVGVQMGALNIASASGRIVIGGVSDRYMVCNTVTALLNGDESSVPAYTQPQRPTAQPKPASAPVEPAVAQVRKPSVDVVQCEQLSAGVCSECGLKRDMLWKCIVKYGAKYRERKMCKFCIDSMKKQ